MNARHFIAASLVSLFLLAVEARAEQIGYYVARDANPTSGANPNPNFGRLTLLYNHGDHFHSIGRFGGGPNLLPEANRGRLTLFAGTGDMEGRFVSKRYDDGSPAAEYSDLRIGSIRNLSGFDPGSPEDILLTSSNYRWVSGPEHPIEDRRLSLEGSLLALEVLSLSSGLNASIGNQVASSVGDILELGPGDSFLAHLNFFTDLGIGGLQDLSASFRLVDLSTGGTPIGGSGEFFYHMATVPEPSTIVMLGIGLAGALAVGWRRRRTSPVA
ncbi:all3515 family Zur-repressed PEP-CTERM protein [Tautonia marina]|uniref:all3515 family Zur-repressed PEP-CTERM protein n=1 Tax=Tautonia marina TaxID=2653855 RepID=UPI001261331A|nr:all3515 family Zur-repressed PEP-CTERM protein [Tautonia marina]